MTLSEALQALAPLTADLAPDITAAREQAAVIVSEELRRLAARVRPADAGVDDAVQKILVRLLQGGPRGSRDGIQTDEQARGYLVTAIRNGVRDGFRRGRKYTDVDHTDPANESLFTEREGADGRPPSSSRHPDPLSDLLDAERHAFAAEVASVLYDEALPEVARAAKPHASEAFAQTVRDIRDLAHERVTMADIMAREGSPDDGRLRNKLYQQQARAKGAFLEGLRAWLRQRALAAAIDAAVRRLAEFDMSSRVPRGEDAA